MNKEFAEAVRALLKAHRAHVLAVLTPAQLARYDQILAKKKVERA